MTDQIISIGDKKFKLVEIVEENKERWVPEVDSEYFYLDESGSERIDNWMCLGSDMYRLSIGNVHKTSEQLQLYKTYQIAMNVPSTAKKGEDFWFWSFPNNCAMSTCYDFRYNYLFDIQFATKAECQAWGDEYAENVRKYRESLLNN